MDTTETKPLDQKKMDAIIEEVKKALDGGEFDKKVMAAFESDDDVVAAGSDEFLPPEFTPEEIAEQDALLAQSLVDAEQRRPAVRNPNAVPFERTTGLELAQRQLAMYDPSFIAFAKAAAVTPPYTPPPPPLTRGQKIKRRIRAIIAVIAAKLVVFWHGIKAKLGFKRTPPALPSTQGYSMQIDKIPGIETYLNPSAFMLSRSQKNSLWVEVDGPLNLAMARFASVRVPLEPDGSVHPRYVKRWANFLNALADSGEWIEGCLAGPSMMSLAMSGDQPRYEKVFFTFPHTKQMWEDSALGGRTPADVLNEKFKCQVFTDEGGVAIASLDSTFPW